MDFQRTFSRGEDCAILAETTDEVHDMVIRKTRMEELDAMMELYDGGRRWMRQNGNLNQWTNGYPSREQIVSDIESGNSYVVEENGEVLAVFYYIHGKDVEPTYAVIDGAWMDDAPYGVIHRIASTGKAPGMVQLCSDWALEQWPILRIDTYQDNHPMQTALERAGFSRCGVIHLMDGSPRIAFQKNKN